MSENSRKRPDGCPQLPGTLLRVFIPGGTVINLLNLIEVSSPSGICLIIRLPFIDGKRKYSNLINTIAQAGGTVEFIEE
jgi:hypothetical protein